MIKTFLYYYIVFNRLIVVNTNIVYFTYKETFKCSLSQNDNMNVVANMELIHTLKMAINESKE